MKDLQVQFITFCDYAMTSQEGKLSIIGIFDEVRVTQFPGGIASTSLVALIKGKPDTAYALKIKGDKGKQNVFPQVEVTIRTGIAGTSNVTINLTNLIFPETGEYTFTITHEEKEIGAAILRVSQVNKQQGMTYSLPN